MPQFVTQSASVPEIVDHDSNVPNAKFQNCGAVTATGTRRVKVCAASYARPPAPSESVPAPFIVTAAEAFVIRSPASAMSDETDSVFPPAYAE